jgi:hypothetical protein
LPILPAFSTAKTMVVRPSEGFLTESEEDFSAILFWCPDTQKTPTRLPPVVPASGEAASDLSLDTFPMVLGGAGIGWQSVPIAVPEIPGESVGNDNVCATVEKVKHSARKKSFTPSGVSSYAVLRPRARTESRHDSCNTAPG